MRAVGFEKPDLLPLAHGAVDQSHVRDGAPVAVVVAVKDHGPQDRVGVARRRRNPLHNARQQFVDADPGFCAGQHHVGGVEAEALLHLGEHLIHAGVDEIDLVDHRHDCQIEIDRGIGVGHGLGLDPLKRVDQQHGPLAAGKAAGNLVVEIDVAGGVDEVELIDFPLVGVFHAHGAGLDRDPPLPLQLHVVEHLLLELTLLHGARPFEQSVGQCALAVVDVGDDRKITDVLAVYRHKQNCSLWTGIGCEPA